MITDEVVSLEVAEIIEKQVFHVDNERQKCKRLIHNHSGETKWRCRTIILPSCGRDPVQVVAPEEPKINDHICTKTKA